MTFVVRVLTISLIGSLAGCDGGELQTSDPVPATPTPATERRVESDARPTLTGVVTDAGGKPLAGATVFADATAYSNTNLEARSGDDGRYRIELPDDGMQTTWRAHAHLTREYHGRRYRFDLHPDNDAPFAGREGAVRISSGG